MQLPDREETVSLLDLSPDSNTPELIDEVLYRPLRSFFSKSGKSLRSLILNSACLLTHPQEEELSDTENKRCLIGIKIVEGLHSGALIVDDIEDQSATRRDQPALYLEYGTPIALNSANWLYFWALHQLQDICHQHSDPTVERDLVRVCHSLLLQAHFGQALDVGVKIDELAQEKVHEACMSSIELKTGALAALAAQLGVCSADHLPSPARVRSILKLGKQLGTALQICEDLGNAGSANYAPAKRREDLRLRRPSFVWSFVARNFSAEEYREFGEVVRQIDTQEQKLDEWMEKHSFQSRALLEVDHWLDALRHELQKEFGSTHPICTGNLVALLNRLKQAYR